MRRTHVVVALLVALAAVLFLAGVTNAQEAEGGLAADLVVAKVRAGAVRLPGDAGQHSVSEVVFASARFESLLVGHGVLTIRKTFSHAVEGETLGVTRRGETVRILDLSQVFTLRLGSRGDAASLVRDLGNTDCVISASRVPLLELCGWSDPPAADSLLADNLQWGLHNIGGGNYVAHADIDVKHAWQIETGDESVLLAILDTGIAYDHADLSPKNGQFEDCLGSGCKVVGGMNLRDPWDCGYFDDPYDCCEEPLYDGHGTSVAAIAAGFTNNVVGPWNGGAAGVAGGWTDAVGQQELGASLLGYRVVPDPYGELPLAISSAVTAGADITNMSFKMGYFPGNFEAPWYAMINAFQMDVVQTAGMGNSIRDPFQHPDAHRTPAFPAAAEQGVIAVGASSFNDQRVSWTPQYGDFLWQSRIGNHIDVVAPGQKHYTASNTEGACTDGYPHLAEFSGTSCAAPFVSGIAALLLSQDPMLSNEQVEAIICASAKDLIYSDPTNNTYAYPG